MVDFEIHYADGRTAVGEVFTDTDDERAETYQHIRADGFELAATGLSMLWHLWVEPRSKMRQLRRVACEQLERLELAGLTPNVLTATEGAERGHPLHVLRALGVSAVSCRAPAIGDDRHIWLVPGGVTYGLKGSADSLVAALGGLLRRDEFADVRAKLGASGAGERHAFLGVTMGSAPCFHSWLSRQNDALPSRGPDLPLEITHLWLWCADLPGHRVLAWFPDRGWFDPALNWATA